MGQQASSISGALARVADFHQQFLCSREPLEAPPGWLRAASAGWHLLHHPALPVARLSSAAGADAGFALGHLIGPEGRVHKGPLELPHAGSDAARSEPTVEQLERFLYRFGGRWVVVVLLLGSQRVYLDPVGSLAAVWCRERRRVASTPTLLLLDEPDHPLFRHQLLDLESTSGNAYFPAGLTSVPGIRRIVTNHFLDLEHWEARRHHPKGYREASRAEIPEIVATYHQIVRRQIGAAVEECGGAYLGLTSGYDSRRILACGRDFVDRLEGVTSSSPSSSTRRAGRVDAIVATRLADLAGLRHQVIPLAPRDPERARDYSLRIGYCGASGKGFKFRQPFLDQLDMSRAWMTGHGPAEDFLRLRAPLDGAPDLRAFARAINFPRKSLAALRGYGIEEAVERWLQEAPEGPPLFHLQLAFVENRRGSWAAVHLYGAAPFRLPFYPVSHREVVDALLSLPTDYRRDRGLTRDLLQRAWPELLRVPFNPRRGTAYWRERAHALLRWR